MPRIELISRRKAGPELRRAYDRLMKLWGTSVTPPLAAQIVQCFCHRPATVLNVGRGYHYVGWGGELPRTVRETMAVLVSRENECFY
ncbi:MAG: hypothetical protein O7G30_11885 [Proteobacteria bacterium]|nr:hypothetical protein [Pseudomonadota bacterium]